MNTDDSNKQANQVACMQRPKGNIQDHKRPNLIIQNPTGPWIIILDQTRHTRALLDQTRVLVDQTRALLDHTRALLDHTRVLLDHTRVLLDQTRVLLDHARPFWIVNNFNMTMWEHTGPYITYWIGIYCKRLYKSYPCVLVYPGPYMTKQKHTMTKYDNTQQYRNTWVFIDHTIHNRGLYKTIQNPAMSYFISEKQITCLWDHSGQHRTIKDHNYQTRPLNTIQGTMQGARPRSNTEPDKTIKNHAEPDKTI